MSDELEFEAEVDVPISAIEHFSYCPRQCGLIHIEQTFEENLFTIRGQLAHERVDSGIDTVSRGTRFARAVPLWSQRLGLSGKADLVEFRATGPYPVEYKVGQLTHHAELQLCAQALCLEEMLAAEVPIGALYSHALRERREIRFQATLRSETERAIAAVRVMLTRQQLPPAANDSRCPRCSLINACIPWVVGEPDRLRGLQGALYRPLGEPLHA